MIMSFAQRLHSTETGEMPKTNRYRPMVIQKLTRTLCHSLSTRLLMTRNDRLVIKRCSLPLRHVKCAVFYVLVGQCCEKNVFESWRMNESTWSSCKKKNQTPVIVTQENSPFANLDDSTILIVKNLSQLNCIDRSTPK